MYALLHLDVQSIFSKSPRLYHVGTINICAREGTAQDCSHYCTVCSRAMRKSRTSTHSHATPRFQFPWIERTDAGASATCLFERLHITRKGRCICMQHEKGNSGRRCSESPEAPEHMAAMHTLHRYFDLSSRSLSRLCIDGAVAFPFGAG